MKASKAPESQAQYPFYHILFIRLVTGPARTQGGKKKLNHLLMKRAKDQKAVTRQRKDQSFLPSFSQLFISFCQSFSQTGYFSHLMLYFTISYLFCLQYAILSLVCRWILGSKWYLGSLFKLVFNKLWLNKFPAAAAKSLQLCLTLCDPIDSSPPGSPVPGILQARTLEWVVISLSNARK